ncbi:MAG: TIGR04255 family protein, partial [Pirellulales bacterium]
MAFEEVFPNPLVRTVAFQITFPNLFFLESRIGDFQIKIMKQFPASQLLIQRDMLIMIGDIENRNKLSEEITPPQEARRIWRFLSEQGVRLDVTLDSLTLLSETHKSYNLGEGPRFRDTIDFVCRSFVAVTQLPIIKRVGLRYIDRCPVPTGSNEAFLEYYNMARSNESAIVILTEVEDSGISRRHEPDDLFYIRYSRTGSACGGGGTVAVHSLKLALHDCGETVMKGAWMSGNSRMIFAGGGSPSIGWS